MFLKLKSKKVKILITLLMVTTVLIATMSCTDKSPIGPGKGRITVQLLVYQNQKTDLNEFLYSYREYDLLMIDYHWEASYIVNFSFDRNLINEIELLRIFSNDPRVVRAELEPFYEWVSGEFVARLKDEIKDHAFDDFLLSYEEYELKVIFHDKLYNRIKFSFDHQKIDQILFHELIRNDDRVWWLGYNTQLPDWFQGVIELRLHDHIRDDNLVDFLLSYSEFDISFILRNEITNEFYVRFDQNFVDEFEVLFKLKDDFKMVLKADFVYFISS